MFYEKEIKHHYCDVDVNDIIDQIQVMRIQEQNTYSHKDYLKEKLLQVNEQQDTCIDKLCRSKMCEWSFQVAEFCQFKEETVDIAMSFLDRFVSSDHPRAHIVFKDRKEYQLAAMTTLYIAVKIFEPCILDLDIMTSLSHDTYFPEEFAKMERDILSGLKWNLNGPTSSNFIYHFLALLPPVVSKRDDVLDTLSAYATIQSILSTKDYNLSLQLPSTIATCAILNAMHCVDYQHFSRRERKEYIANLQYLAGIDLQQFCFIETKYLLSNLLGKSSQPEIKTSSPKTNYCGISSFAKNSRQSKPHTKSEHGSSPVCILHESISSNSTIIDYNRK